MTLRRGLGVLAGGFVLWLFAVWPPPVWYRTHWPAETAFMAMREREGRTPERARAYRPVPLDSIAPAVVEAVLIGEDQRFWEHGGVDFQALRHALGYRRDTFSWTSARDRAELVPALRRAWERRRALRGASTVTQQLAKNLYLSPSRNPLRKLKEAVTAYRLEAALGKRRILELYLSVAELGHGVWGVEAASRRYFDRPARRLTRRQAAALAASLPFPLSSNPAHRPGRMRWRQSLILRRMEGERVEVPKLATEDELPPPPAVPPAVDSVIPVAAPPLEPDPLGQPDPEPAGDSTAVPAESVAVSSR
ncbi:MAG TPA: biosynthetic peptidoglycan transglycosylase [Gemmatimonadales bacterium]|nr:biosynthetic peptidoglycan transglycosylase [Gemmatimonadales bacterium]